MFNCHGKVYVYIEDRGLKSRDSLPRLYNFYRYLLVLECKYHMLRQGNVEGLITPQSLICHAF